MDGAHDSFWAVRNHLNKLAGRRSDRLTFDKQEIIAAHLRYGGRVGAAPDASDEEIEGAMVEAFMSDYYRHARAVNRAREEILRRATPPTGPTPPRENELGPGLRWCDGQIT